MTWQPKRRLGWLWPAAALGLLALAAGPGSGLRPASGQASAETLPQDRAGPPAGPVVEVSIDNFTFAPAEITIAPGTTVKWVNRDDIPHTVVEATRSFKSKALDTDDSFTMTFAAAGSYSYFCSLHPHMTGKVIVRAGS